MKKNNMVAFIAMILALSIIASLPFITDASQSKTISDIKSELDASIDEGDINIDEYVEKIDEINNILAQRNVEELETTVTFEQPINTSEVLELSADHDAELFGVEVRFLDGEEKYTAFIMDSSLEAFNAQIDLFADDYDIEYQGVISANVIIDSTEIVNLSEEEIVYCADASASDFVEGKSNTPTEDQEVFRKSLAWELGN